MDDSFSQLARKIRRDKMNKRQLRRIKREIIDEKVLNIIKNDMAIKIQSCVRRFLYRKKFLIFLDEMNTETIIDYLYLKKIERIEADCKNIISKHMTNYLTKIREEKNKLNKKKIKGIDLIKAYLKGIILRKRFSKELSSLKDIKDKIERYILGYTIKLILSSNNIQSLLVDIANIKYALYNIDENNDGNSQKKKELKTKLSKSIDLFYFTFYQMKENSNWISQTKIKEPWMQKYMNIIKKGKENDIENDNDNKIINIVRNKSIYSNQKKIRRLKENNKSDSNNNNNNNRKDSLRNIDNNSNSNLYIYDKDSTINERELIHNIDNSNMIKNNMGNKDNDSRNNSSEDNNNNDNIIERNKTDKKYDLKFYDSDSGDDTNENKSGRKSLHRGTETFRNKKYVVNQNIMKKSKTLRDENMDSEENETINQDKYKNFRNNSTQRYRTKKSEVRNLVNENHLKSLKSFDDKEYDDKDEEEIMDNNRGRTSVNKDRRNYDKSEKNKKKLNKYEQREERPIKPLANNNFLENDNPFGLKRDSNEYIPDNDESYPVAKKKSIEKRILNSTRAINRTIISYNQKSGNKKQNISEIEKEETTIKTQEKTDLSLNEVPLTINKYEEYDNRPCGGGLRNNAIYEQAQDKLDRNERPLGGANKIDYNAMFGEGGYEFEGDPFGGAKQYESSNKDRVKNIHKTNNIKKKPVYDARKAIEEAKLKEAKEGKKEKPSAFREFLREMKKITAEEKAQHNETNTNSVKKQKKSKNKKIEKKENNLEYSTENNITTDKNMDKFDTQDRMPKRVGRRDDKKKNMNIDNEEKDESSNVGINTEEKDNVSVSKKKPRGANMNKETNALRKKLHELEKAPAPVLNIKGIKSRIECWGNNNDNKRSKMNSMAPKSKETPKAKDDLKFKNMNSNKIKDGDKDKENDKKLISNYINNKKAKELSDNYNSNSNGKSVSSNNVTRISKNMEEKIAKYVDKKLMQLNKQIDEINGIFNLDKYFKDKEKKMKQYLSLPYIKQNYDFVANYSNDKYDDKMDKIQKIYKELK